MMFFDNPKERVMIIFKDDSTMTAYGVKRFGYDKKTNCFYLDKDGRRSYIEKDSVVYIGEPFTHIKYVRPINKGGDCKCQI